MISGAPITKAKAESLRIIEYSLDQAGIESLRVWGRIIEMIACGVLMPRAQAALNWPAGRESMAPRKMFAW